MNETTKAPKRIVDKAFAKRLGQACTQSPRAPSGHGQQKWMVQELDTVAGVKVSPEAVRKWFAGESRPRPQIMSKVAQILQVDEAWLSLGITPDRKAADPRRHNAIAHGAVNLVAGLFQLGGASVAFSEGRDHGPDFVTIIDGKPYEVEVKFARPDQKVKIAVSPGLEGNRLRMLVSGAGAQPSTYTIYNLSPEFLEKHGINKGGYIELDLEFDGFFGVGDDLLPVIKDMKRLEGEVPRWKSRTRSR